MQAVFAASGKTELAVRHISVPQRAFLDGIAKAVNAPPLAAGEGVHEVEDGAKLKVQIPSGAKSVVYTLGNETIEQALEKIALKDSVAITVDLKGNLTGPASFHGVGDMRNFGYGLGP